MTLSSRFGPRPEECRLLIAEPDPSVGTGLRDFFLLKDYRTTLVQCGPRAFEELASPDAYDAAILGVRLPDKTGFSVLREIRRQGVDTPVVFLTTLVATDHKVRAFQLGADDYVTQPFDLEELVARIRAVLRRRTQRTRSREVGSTYSFGTCTVDFQIRRVTENEQDLGLTETEFDILEYLVRSPGQPVAREELLREVWGITPEVKTRRLSRHVSSLRRKIEPDPEEPRYIQTVVGVGYKFAG